LFETALQLAALRDDVQEQGEIGVRRIERIGLGQIGQSPGQHAGEVIGKATAIVAGCGFGIEFDRLAVIGDSAVEFALEAIRRAAVVIGGRGAALDRRAVIGDGAIEIALRPVGKAAPV
jgi:hypothetical protein